MKYDTSIFLEKWPAKAAAEERAKLYMTDKCEWIMYPDGLSWFITCCGKIHDGIIKHRCPYCKKETKAEEP